MATKQAPKTVVSKIAELHALFDAQAHGELLPRSFMQALGEAAGFNPATVRTQAQRWLMNRRGPLEVQDEAKAA